jgi:hypothetical protein
MYTYNETDRFPIARNVDTTDVVLGGSTGAANLPLQDLADRTFWLKKRMGSFFGVTAVAADFTVDISFINTLVYITAAGPINGIFSTDATLGNFPVGARIFFHVVQASQYSPVTINRPGGAPIYLYDGEQIELSRHSSFWVITHQKGNFDFVGEDALVRTQPANSIIALGDIYSRADLIRLWTIVQPVAILESTWLSDLGGKPRYRAFFSSGNNGGNFRVPDLRGLSEKALDYGRGLSFGRLDLAVGGYEEDALKDHHHITTLDPTANSDTGSGKVAVGGDGPEGIPPKYNTGGPLDNAGNQIGATETKVKTWGKLPVIYY